MNDEQLIRYKRHLMLPQVDIAGQERLFASRVLVIGAGGLGSPVLMYLVAAGVGKVVVYDDDKVEISNLQRQVLFEADMLGREKSAAAAERLRHINADVEVIPVQSRITEDLLDMELPHVDLVLDCSDNFTTRFSVNRACVKHAKPLVSGAAIRMEGQVSVFNGHHPKKPCYQCLYQPDGENQENCTSNGVLGPVVGVIGSIMACEAIKILTGIGETLEGRLLLFDAQLMRFNEVRLGKDPQCPVCG